MIFRGPNRAVRPRHCRASLAVRFSPLPAFVAASEVPAFALRATARQASSSRFALRRDQLAVGPRERASCLPAPGHNCVVTHLSGDSAVADVSGPRGASRVFASPSAPARHAASPRDPSRAETLVRSNRRTHEQQCRIRRHRRNHSTWWRDGQPFSAFVQSSVFQGKAWISSYPFAGYLLLRGYEIGRALASSGPNFWFAFRLKAEATRLRATARQAPDCPVDSAFRRKISRT
jgi:hypothetical protein